MTMSQYQHEMVPQAQISRTLMLKRKQLMKVCLLALVLFYSNSTKHEFARTNDKNICDISKDKTKPKPFY